MPRLPNKNSFSYENPLITRMGRTFFQELPLFPAVYFMRDRDGEVLYIGKAKCLKNRLKQYAQAKPGAAPERVLEMLESVASICWEAMATEENALAREAELLSAIRPPYNIAGTDAEHYLSIGIRREGEHLHFQLSSRPNATEAGYEVSGCFRNRSKVKAGYTALLRLIHAAQVSERRFAYPARITRASPPWLYSARAPQDWDGLLLKFLSGTDIEFLELILDRLLQNEFLPRFMYPSIQEDLEIVRSFYEFGPRQNYELKRLHGLRRRTISHQKMDQLIASTLNLSTSFNAHNSPHQTKEIATRARID